MGSHSGRGKRSIFHYHGDAMDAVGIVDGHSHQEVEKGLVACSRYGKCYV